MDRMFCYLWYESNKPDECKFGERWVKSNQDPQKEVIKRIKSSLGVRKDLFKDGTVKLAKYWDVTDYAKMVGRYYQRSRVDDHIRPHIGFRKGSTGEIHQLPADDVQIRVDRLLAKMGQPLPVVGLSAWQARTIERTMDRMANGHQTIVAELCARFGKTIWSGALIRETGAQLTIIVSYVLTSFSSFEKDLSGYQQFKDMVVIDAADPEYKQVVDAAISNGKQVVVFLSMCKGTKRNDRIKYLFGKKCKRLVIVDEADFGVHKSGQAKPLLDARKKGDTVVLMTGTNADKAATHWPVDDMISVVYPELIMEKKNPARTYTTTLKNFTVDPLRHSLVVDVQFYQMDLKGAVDLARKTDPELFVDDGIYLPSWTKAAADPNRAKGFLTRMFQAVFLAQHGLDELNVDHQINRRPGDPPRVAMMFMPGSTTNDNMELVINIAKQSLPGYHVVGVYGDAMTNRTAEVRAKEEIEMARKRGESVLMISAGMAQRSFSVGEITELYLAYDSGDNGATIQKMSRALTPDGAGKVGRIISLSFDPNRDDKFDAMLIETAINYKRNRGLDSAKEAMRQVIRTVDIFRCLPEGATRIDGDAYLEEAIERRSVSRVIGKVSDLSPLTTPEIIALTKGNSDVYHAAKRDAAQTGKTRKPGAPAAGQRLPNNANQMAKIIARAKEMITTVVENMDIIMLGTGEKVLEDAFDSVDADPVMRSAIREEFGLDFDLIRDLFDRGVINRDLIELQIEV